MEQSLSPIFFNRLVVDVAVHPLHPISTGKFQDLQPLWSVSMAQSTSAHKLLSRVDNFCLTFRDPAFLAPLNSVPELSQISGPINQGNCFI